jgi:hypothetical protein
MEPSHKIKESPKQLSPMVWVGIIAGILIIGFFAGIHYLKSSSTPKNAGAGFSSGGPQMMGGPGGAGAGGEPCANGQPKAMLMLNGQQVETCGMPINGTITNVATNAVTITDSSGASKTFTVTDQTKVIKKGGAGTLADMKSGDTLNVIPNENDETVAGYLMINPPQQGTTL